MRITKIGNWEESELELYHGNCGMVISCDTKDELLKLMENVKDLLFQDVELKLTGIKKAEGAE